MASLIRIENTNVTVGPKGFIFHRDYGVVVTKFDPGYPAIRDVVDNNPQAHGTTDYTTFLGNRPVGLEFRIWAGWSKSRTTRRDILDILYGLCNPALRPFIYESIDDRPERRIMVRADQLTSPFELPHTNAVQMQWIAPIGVWESGEVQTTEIGASGTGTTVVGRTYPLTRPRAYAPSEPTGGKIVINQGNIVTYPTFVVHGPLNDVAIVNQATGKRISFVGLNLLAGEAVVVDCRPDHRSIYVSGQPNVSRYDKVNWTVSSWLELAPGENVMAFNPTGYSEATKLVVAYRHNWI